MDLFIALPETRPGWSSRDEKVFQSHLHQLEVPGGHRLRLHAVGYGHAGGLDAIRQAKTMMDARKLELCLIAGVDSYWDADTLDALQDARRLAGEALRSGFEPGEAAGCLVLASSRMVQQMRWTPWGQVSGAGSAREQRTWDSDETNLGEGLMTAISIATSHWMLPDQAADAVYSDLNGERYRSEEWGLAILRHPWVTRDPTTYYAPATSWGDVGAASGILETILAIESWR